MVRIGSRIALLSSTLSEFLEAHLNHGSPSSSPVRPLAARNDSGPSRARICARRCRTRDISTRGVYLFVGGKVKAGVQLNVDMVLAAGAPDRTVAIVRAVVKVMRVEQCSTNGQRVGWPAGSCATSLSATNRLAPDQPIDQRSKVASRHSKGGDEQRLSANAGPRGGGSRTAPATSPPQNQIGARD